MRSASSRVGLATAGALGPVACGNDTAATGAGGQTSPTSTSGTGGAAEGGTGVGRSHVVHFGLGAARPLKTVTVRWPSGLTKVVTGADVCGRRR